MEQKKLIDQFNDLFAAIVVSGPEIPDRAFPEAEAILFAAALNKDEYLPINFSKEGDFARYLSHSDRVKEIDINQVLRGVTVYSPKIHEQYLELRKLSDEEIAFLFEYAHSKVVERNRGFGGDIDTAKEIAELVFSLYPEKEYKTLVDVCSGKGEILTAAIGHGFTEFKGYEINNEAATYSKMRALVHGANYNIEVCDVLQKELSEKYDVAFTQPPFSLRTFKATVKDKDETFKYKESEKTIKADWHFIIKALNSTNKEGKTIALVADGVLFNTPDAFYRKQVIENNRLEAVISLPQGILVSAGVKTSLLVFSENNETVKFIDAGDCFISENAYKRRLDVDAVCKLFNDEDNEKTVVIDYSKLDSNTFVLSVGRYMAGDLAKEVKFPAILKEHAAVVPGYQYRSNEEKDPSEADTSVVKITNIVNGVIDYDSLATLDSTDRKLDKYLLRENDILVSTKGTAIKFALVENVGDKRLVAHNNLSVIRCKEGLDPVYLICFLKSNIGMQMLKAKQSGAVIMNITQKAIEDLTISLPDDDTQKVIASRYRILLRDISRIKEELAAAEAKISTIWEDEVGE